MKQVDEMPTSGQFVAVWVFDGNPFADTLLWDEGDLKSYQETETNHFFKDESHNVDFYRVMLAKYFIAD